MSLSSRAGQPADAAMLVISHGILTYNRGRTSGLADGIVVTPSHNPPEDGGFKYNPPHGGPAGADVTPVQYELEVLERAKQHKSRVY